jgi:hypothetical protein
MATRVTRDQFEISDAGAVTSAENTVRAINEAKSEAELKDILTKLKPEELAELAVNIPRQSRGL